MQQTFCNRDKMFPIVLLALAVILLALPPVTAADQPDDDALKTPEGNLLKVIVREPAALLQKPENGSPSRPTAQFQFYYVRPARKGTQDKTLDGYYRVATAPRESAAVGWIHKEHLLEWSHVQVLGFRPLDGRKKAEVPLPAAIPMKV